jgi:hypothetical protein
VQGRVDDLESGSIWRSGRLGGEGVEIGVEDIGVVSERGPSVSIAASISASAGGTIWAPSPR